MPSTLNQQRSTSFQRRLDIKLEVSAPLMDLGAVRGVLERDQVEILNLIDDIKLAWAWDIGLGRNRSEVRILTKCVKGFHTKMGAGHACDCGLADAKEDDIIGWILARESIAGRPKPFIDTTRLQDLFICSGHLIYDLVNAGDLRLVPGSSAPRRGRNGQGSITRESVVQFLKQRRMK